MKLSPYLIVENVAKTAEFYQSVFGGEIKILNKQKEQVLHGEFIFLKLSYCIYLAITVNHSVMKM